MATQHPDNACVPWWHDSAFIETQDEIEELQILFQELPIDEYMWDWEGKYVDEAVGEKLFSRAHALFAKRPLGEELHLTYRIPAFDGHKMHRMARAFMNVLSLADLADDLHLHHPPVTELFLPLTTSADQPIKVRETFRKVSEYHRSIFHAHSSRTSLLPMEALEVTPLVEDVPSLIAIESILRPYWFELQKEKPNLADTGQRVFLARSDPAMNAGLIPAVLAVKVALSESARVAEEFSMPVYPILGTGSLPFRGSVNPSYTHTFLDQYAGTRTYSIQSAFRYDYPLEDVKSALATIRREAPTREVLRIPLHDRERIATLATQCTALWQPTIESLATIINAIARFIPKRRERLQHIGLFGYSRGVGTVTLPRAIGFTAALYSLGIPPELIGTGRGLRIAKQEQAFDLIETYYPALRADLLHAGKYLNRENLSLLARSSPVFESIETDIAELESILGITLSHDKPHHIMHRNITSTILHRYLCNPDDAVIASDIVQAGMIRRSLG